MDRYTIVDAELGPGVDQRDIEVGDVDGDGQDEWIVATHDAGVVAVIEPPALADLGAAVSRADHGAGPKA